MNTKKKWVIASAAIALAIFVFGGTAYINHQNSEARATAEPYQSVVQFSSSTWLFDTPQELDENVDLVVIGSAVDDFLDRDHEVTTYEDGYVQDFYTRTKIKIDKILKNTSQFPEDQKELTLLEPVSLDQGQKLTRDNYIELQKDDPSVIFLKKNSFGDYFLVNRNRGKVSLTEEDPQLSIQTLKPVELSEYQKFRNETLDFYQLRQ